MGLNQIVIPIQEGVSVKQQIDCLDGEVAIAYDHIVTKPSKTIRGKVPKLVASKVGNNPCIRIIRSKSGEPVINTQGTNRGVICFLPVWCKGIAVISVRVQKVMKNSMYAIPNEYIESNPRLNTNETGELARNVYNSLHDAVSHGYGSYRWFTSNKENKSKEMIVV